MFNLSTLRRNQALALLFVLLAAPSWGKVILRWTQASIPAAAKLGLADLVVSWDDEALIKVARSQGYRVYAELPISKVTAAATMRRNDLAGIILSSGLTPGDTPPNQVDDAIHALQSDYPGLPILFLDTRAKQPKMKGQLVIKKDGILQVTSPTEQPWIDSNLALVRLEQAFCPAQTPLYEFSWDLSDPLQQKQGPNTADYLLAVAEAAAFHADLVLKLHPRLQAELLQNKPAAWEVLHQIQRYVSFASQAGKESIEVEANVAAILDTFRNSFEPINLLARHNIPFQVLPASGLKPLSFNAFDLIVLFAPPDKTIAESIAEFAARGGVAVLVGAPSSDDPGSDNPQSNNPSSNNPGSYPWRSRRAIPAGEHAVSYVSGKGRIIELQGTIADPETFAQDIRRLLRKDKDTDRSVISLWNSLTTLAVPYQTPSGSEKLVELVNYAAEPLRVQVRIKGSFSSLLYESPEQACCKSLTPVQRNGFTEFVVPSLRIAGRVHLAQPTAPYPTEGK